MKKSIALTAKARNAQKKAEDLRKDGVVPCVLYGNNVENTSIECDAKAFHKAYGEAGSNTVVDVEVDGKKIPCLIHAVALDPVTSAYKHVDFYAVDMTKKVTAYVPVVLEGEAPAVKNLGGVLLTPHDELEVECLPSDIPESFKIDITGLENFHDHVTVASVQAPQGVAIKTSEDTMLVTVQEPRKEEEIAPAASEETAEGEEGATAEGEAGEKAEGDAAEKAESGDKKEPEKEEKK